MTFPTLPRLMVRPMGWGTHPLRIDFLPAWQSGQDAPPTGY